MALIDCPLRGQALLVRCFLLFMIVVLALPAHAQAPQRRLAVLQFAVAKGLEIDRETFSARVQNAARRASPELFVMTQANIETLVRAQGKSLEQCEGQCAVDTGKLIGADLVIGGRISSIGRTYAISMQMYDTASGELTGGEDVSARTEDELLNALEGAAAKLVSSLGTAAPPEQAKAPEQATAAAGPAKGMLKVVSAPSGAKVSIDGDAVGATPLTLKREVGTYVVSIEIAGYAPVSRQVELAAGKAAVVSETLMQAAGYIDVTVAPEAAARAASVTVDGKAAGAGKQGPYKVGKHAVRAEAAGYRAAEQQTGVDNGGIAQVALTLEALPGKLLLSVNVEAECSAGGAKVSASPEGVTKLEAPAGSARVTCRAEGHDDASADVEVSPGRAQAVKLTLKRASAEAGGQGGTEPKSGLRFVSIPAGSFQYQGERSVSVKAFKLGETDVTVAAYARCVSASACTAPPTKNAEGNWKTGRDDHPVNCVDWNQSTTFCKWIGGRLPTEEEWEYVASGGSEGRTYPWGSEEPGARACWDGEGSDLGNGNRKTTCAVGSHKGADSKWGLHDLSGNVWQWTSSDYNASQKVLRGGSWLKNSPEYLRARFRYRSEPSDRDGGIGFRCVL